jgi:hypothetical protein
MRRSKRLVPTALIACAVAGASIFAGPAAAPVAQAPCGGVERWAVKVGSDASAGTIDLDDVVDTSLHNLISPSRPTLPPNGDSDTRLTQERTVCRVEGRLVRFKLESGRDGDQDFHLFVTDGHLAV